MGYYDYITAAQKREYAKKSLDKLRSKNPNVQPILIIGNIIATTWWGKAWNKNLESYADYSNRIVRGRSYVRSGSVLDLKLENGQILALVQGSRKKPYEVSIYIDPINHKSWEEITQLTNRKFESFEQLVEGKFPHELESLFTSHGGIFPSPMEIHYQCSCPDSASLCKHIAATLYGIGARLDTNPMLFFEMRDIHFEELLKKSVESKLESMLKNADNLSPRRINDKDIYDVFGI